MSNTNIDLIGLDFNTVKANLKNWYKNNTQFKDIDFEGSNITELIELLAYNTYLNSYYTNMIGAEMFLDSAQLRDSVVSHSKELNYTPRSFNSASATVNVVVTPSNTVTSVVMVEGTTFTTKVGSNTFTFSTQETSILDTSDGVHYSANVTIYEGAPVTESFITNYANAQQRFILSNPTVDTNTIQVDVYEDTGTTRLSYIFTDALFGVDNDSQIFFTQAAENQQYEVLFGDGIFGRRPKDGSTVVISYLASSGEQPNGATLFTSDGAIDGWSAVTVTNLSAAGGGAVNESIESIRFKAPRYYQTQGRATTESDYEVLLKNQFAEIQAISVYGGEQVDPPVYGKVFISVDIFGADGAPQVSKDKYQAFLKGRTPLGIDSVFVDPDFMGIDVTTTVKYNKNATTRLTSDIQTLVSGAISAYNLDNLEQFKATLRGSQFVAAIDNADASIVSNDTNLKLIRSVIPTTGSIISIAQAFSQSLAQSTVLNVSANQINYGGTITSSAFKYNAVRSIFFDDSQGNIWIGSYSADSISPVIEVGTINYQTGLLTINNIVIDTYEGNGIKFYATPLEDDITSLRNTILSIADEDVHVTVVGISA